MQDLLSFDAYLKLFLGLFAMVDPIAGAPIFLAMAGPFPKVAQRRMAGVACLTMFFTFILFLFFGDSVLGFFSISRAAFITMGGIVLLFMGLDLLRSEGGHEEVSHEDEEINKKSWLGVAVVPIAIPILSGPGALTTVVIYAGEARNMTDMIALAGVILAVVLITYAFLLMSAPIARLLGSTGLNVLNKIMGMIILAIAIEFLFSGISQYFPHMRGEG